MTATWYWILFALAVAVFVLAGLLFRWQLQRQARLEKREWQRLMQRRRL